MFIHQLSHVWIDFRDIRDEFMRQHDLDYFENSRRATLVQQQYAIRNPREFEHYDECCWGITASDGPGPSTLLVDGIERVFYDYIARGVPFGPDDGTLAPWAVVEVSGVTGYVQQLNVRTTILMALDGNLVQIPNASVYKSNLRNFTTNSNRRDQFEVGIGYDDAISEAQEIALQVLTDHPAVLSEPEPLVLVDSLGKATVNLRVYFWINGREHSLVKVRSSVIRQVKRAYQKHGISMPDEAREVVFPQGIPITMLDGKPAGTPDAQAEKTLPVAGPSEEPDVVATKAEGGLESEAEVLDEQARQAQPLREGENLLPKAPDSSSSEKPARNSPAKSGSTRTSPD